MPPAPTYGQPDPGPTYPQPGGSDYGGIRPSHPQATTALILGILGLVFCGVLAPFAWSMGSKAVREIDANPGQFEGRGNAQAGKILGIVGTVLLGLSLLFLVAFLGLGVALVGT